jgi:hypothetical protein
MLKKKGVGLGDKLRRAVNSVKVDAFGIEKKAIKSIKNYFAHLADATEVQEHLLRLRIRMHNLDVLSTLYNSNRFHKAVELEEVAKFFVGDMANSPAFVERVEKGISDYLLLLADELNHGFEGVCLQISIVGQKPIVQVFVNDKYMGDLTVSQLLKHFL